jgi:hypothetical protein
MIFSPLGKVSDGLDLVKKLSNVDVDETLYPIIPQLVKRILLKIIKMHNIKA